MNQNQLNSVKELLGTKKFEEMLLSAVGNALLAKVKTYEVKHDKGPVKMPGLNCAVCDAPLDGDKESDWEVIHVIPCRVCLDNAKMDE